MVDVDGADEGGKDVVSGGVGNSIGGNGIGDGGSNGDSGVNGGSSVSGTGIGFSGGNWRYKSKVVVPIYPNNKSRLFNANSMDSKWYYTQSSAQKQTQSVDGLV